MTPKFKVLVFPGGTEIAMEIRAALGSCKEVELFSAGSDTSNHAPFVFKNHFIVPGVYEEGWIEKLSEIVTANQITHIFPAHDDCILALAKHSIKFSAKIVTSPYETCRIARSKTRTNAALFNVVPIPSFSPVGIYPILLKPDRGQGSDGVVITHDNHERDSEMAKNPNLTAWEYLPGKEYTVDCFTDRTVGLGYICGRERVRRRTGIAMASKVADRPEFLDYAQRISSVLNFHGAWFYQVKEDAAGVLKVMEVAPRIGGTSALSRARGVNLPLMSLYESEGIACTRLICNYEIEIDRALTNRYKHNINYKTIYVDYDDTLIVKGKVNCDLMKLLYQAKNYGKRLILITRANPLELMRDLYSKRISVFDHIINIDPGELKSDYTTDLESIFIDDSFSERLDVHTKTGIECFDPSMVEALIDHRI